MLTFSVIIPVYNVAQYLHRCVSSALEQSYRRIEIVLVDDGSTDGSGAICDAFSLRDHRVRVIHQKENRGSSVARNVGVAASSGDYILFLDSDDYWKDSEVLSRIAERIGITHADVLSFNYIKVDEEKVHKPYFGCKTMPFPVADSFQYQSNRGIWIACAWNKAIRRKLFDVGSLRFREGVTAEDMDWSVRLALEAEAFDYLDCAVVCYRQRKGSISRCISTGNVEMLKENICCCLSILEEHKGSRSDLLKPFVAYQYATFLFHLSALPESEAKNDLVKRAKEMRWLLKWSQNRKAKMLDWATNLGGLTLTLWLLRLKSRRGF